MAQTKEIIDLKRKLRDTQKALSNGCNPGDTTNAAYPSVTLVEQAVSDDNIFRMNEELVVNVAIRDVVAGQPQRIVPVPEEAVAIFYADRTQEWKATDSAGNVKLKKPRAQGLTQVAIPNILIYSANNSITFKVVE